MTSGLVVAIDPVDDSSSGEILARQRNPVDELGFQRGEPAFRCRIIETRPGSRHRLHDGVFVAYSDECVRGVLAFAVAVEHDLSDVAASYGDRHAKSVDNEGGFAVISDREPDQAT